MSFVTGAMQSIANKVNERVSMDAQRAQEQRGDMRFLANYRQNQDQMTEQSRQFDKSQQNWQQSFDETQDQNKFRRGMLTKEDADRDRALAYEQNTGYRKRKDDI